MSYTGIREIDEVLLDLYDEQVTLEDRLREKPNEQLTERHRRVVGLADKLLEVGRMLHAASVENVFEDPNKA